MTHPIILSLLAVSGSLVAQTPVEPPLAGPPAIEMPAPASVAAPAVRELKVFAQPSGEETAGITSSGPNGELWLDVPPSPFAGGVLLRALAATPSVFTQLGTNASDSAFTVSSAAGSPLFRIRGDGTALFGANPSPYWLRIAPNGNVAIGGYGESNYNARLFVQHGVDGSPAIFGSHQVAFEPGSPGQLDYGLFMQTHLNVQAGATNPQSLIGLYGNAYLTGPGTVSSIHGAIVEVGTSVAGGTLNVGVGLDVRYNRASGSTIGTAYGVYIRDIPATNDYALYQAGADDGNFFAGDVTIAAAGSTGTKLAVNGDATFTGTVTGGNIKAKYQDLAEWVPASSDLAPGTVVVLDPAIGNGVMASHTAYDTSVAGVVSAQPGIVLGDEGEEKEQIATTGRVRVRVDASAQPIRVGDLLVTSDKPGTAMRSEPMEIAGRRFHQPGTIIGKALEPLSGGEGEILVLLSLQ